MTKDHVLEAKLKEARLRDTRYRKKLTIGFLAAIGLCSLILLGLSSFDFSATKQSPETVTKKSHPTEINIEKIREEFKESLLQYKNKLKPELEAANIQQWNPAVLADMNTQEQKAVSYFSNGDYPNALEQIQSLRTKATTILEEAQQIFKDNMQKAASFFAEDRYDEAKHHIEKALMVNAQSPDALALQQDIEKLQRILPLLNDVKVARTENDLHKEYRALQQILDIAPERQQAAERFKLLDQQIRNNEFEIHISAGSHAIKKQQVKKARQHYLQAKKVSPSRKELPVLLSQITEQEKTHRMQNALTEAEKAVQRDDWQQAKVNFTKVLNDTPEDKTAIKGLKRANEILSLQTQLNQYTKDPYRLANTTVLSAAEKTLAQTQQVSNYSSGIKKQAQQLNSLITAFNLSIPVTITSDNKTYVLIRGVGKIGTTSQKLIKLKPGRYTFEGTRDGYKSKLLPVLIPYDQSSFSIRVICDEPI